MPTKFYTGSPSFDAAVIAFLDHVQGVMDENHKQYPNIPTGPVIETEIGPKYVRVIRKETFGSGRSAYCFISRENGDVLFPKGWKGPAKHARGNVYRSETFNCAGPYGVAAMR